MSSSVATPVRQYWAALRVLLVLTVILGVMYPLAVTGVGQLLLRSQANGSLVTVNGSVVGSSLIGQSFTDAKGNPLPQWFQSRPSAAGASGYDPTSSSATNLGPNSPVLVKAIDARRAALAALDGVTPAQVPPDALTSSGSGLDPHISVAAAQYQTARVAAARKLTPGQVGALVDQATDRPWLGVMGEPVVHVLKLNLALDALK